MITKNIVVLPYDVEWQKDFEVIKNELWTVLKDVAIKIEHVGSTSIEGCFAKPIIDIDVVIDNYSLLDSVILKLKQIGYYHEGNFGIYGREAFCYKGKRHFRKHHLYVCPKDSNELKRHIGLRDYLRNNPREVVEYSNIKKEGAIAYPNDIDKYIQHKSYFIEKIYKRLGI